jgi:LacI family transcriptional regulator
MTGVVQGMSTIRDVARMAGVSTATVSHVLNETRSVLPETRQRVLRAIATLNYRRDGIARSLRRSSSGTLGLIVSDISNPYFGDFVRGVEDAVYSGPDQYNIILCNTDEDAEKERTCLDVLRERRVEAIIMVPAGGNHEYLRDLVGSGLPVVFADRYLTNVRADSVVVDNRDSARAIVSRLTEVGHRRIAVMRASLNASAIEDRMTGFADALADAGIAADPDYEISSRSTIEDAHRASLDLLTLPRRPTAVFCTNNFMTLGLIQALSTLGLRCPRDLAVIGFDDFPWASAFHPRLTVVSQPAYAVGRAAASLLFARISGQTKAGAVRHVLKAKILVRDSCGTAKRVTEPSPNASLGDSDH